MSDGRSAWSQATERRRCERVPLQVEDLIVLGQATSIALAERVYRALAQEPRNRDGERVDWLEIRSRIVTGAR
jgi:hypothetical protein